VLAYVLHPIASAAGGRADGAGAASGSAAAACWCCMLVPQHERVGDMLLLLKLLL